MLFFPLTVYAQIEGVALWKLPVGGKVIGLPSVQAGSVVVLSEDKTVRAFSRQGHALWTYESAKELSPYITRSREGANYLCTAGGTLIALNRIGRELWRTDMKASPAGPILLGWDGRLFVPTDKSISCYTTAGRLLWYKNLEGSLAAAPRLDNRGGLIAALDTGELLHIDGFGKTAVTQLSETPALIISLAEAEPQEKGKKDEKLPVLILYKNGGLEVIGGEYPALPGLPAHPVGAANRNGRTAVALKDGQVILLSAEEGKILWAGKSGVAPAESGEDGQETAMIYDERGIYMLSKAGAAGFTEQGQRQWFIRIIGATAVPIFSDEGMLYSGGNDWYLYAYRLENRTLFRQESLYGPPPEGSYRLGLPFPERKDYSNRFSESELKTQFSRIDKALAEGRVGEQEKEFTAFLMEVAGSLRNSVKASQAKPPVQFRERIQAVRLLAVLGSQELIPFLADLFSYEPDPLVKAAAAEAIGAIGVDPEGLGMRAFSLEVLSPGLMKDESVLLAVASAVGDLCRFSGPPVMQAGSSILVALAGADKPPRVRNRALEEIKSLTR